MESTTTTPEREAELIEGFLSRRPTAELAFLAVLRPILRAEVRLHWTSFWRHLDDFEQSALLKLCEMRDADEAIRPPVGRLAKLLIENPARKLRRERKPIHFEDWEPAQPPNQEAAFEIRRLLDIASRLPRGMATTIQCHADHIRGAGPPLHLALGVDKETAHKRLIRAQAAVLRIANGDEVEVEDE